MPALLFDQLLIHRVAVDDDNPIEAREQTLSGLGRSGSQDPVMHELWRAQRPDRPGALSLLAIEKWPTCFVRVNQRVAKHFAAVLFIGGLREPGQSIDSWICTEKQ